MDPLPRASNRVLAGPFVMPIERYARRGTVSARQTYRCIRVHQDSRFEVVHCSAPISRMHLRRQPVPGRYETQLPGPCLTASSY